MKRLVAALLPLLLGACSALTPAPRALDLPAGAAKVAARRLGGDEVAQRMRCLGRTPPAAGQAWDLDALLLAAWTWRGEVAAAELDIAAAEVEAGVAARGTSPDVAATPEYATNADEGTSPWTLSMALSWTLETHGKRGLRREQARAEKALALARLAETLWQVRVEVSRAYLELELARREQSLAADELAVQAEIDAWTRTLLHAGAASQPDALAAAAELSRARAQLTTAAAAEIAARGRLAAALGLPPARLAEIELARPRLEELPQVVLAPDLAAEALQNRLDLHRAVADYALRENSLRLEVAKQYPDFTFGPGYTYDQGLHKLVFGLSLALPNGATQRAAIAKALIARRQAALAAEEIQATALADAAAARERYDAASAALVAAEATRQELERGVAAAEQRLSLGAADHGEVLMAKGLVFAAAQAVLAAQRQRVAALGELEAAVERPLWPASQVDAATAAEKLDLVGEETGC